MRNVCSFGLDLAQFSNLRNTPRGRISGHRCPRSPIQSKLRKRWLATIATWVTLASGGAGAQQADPELIEEGRQLFLFETFDGNGRTCGTCHPPTNNFTIDPAFIKTLKGNDPLFLSSPSAPHLKTIEVRRLLQQFALVLENVDGLDKQGVMRGVPHTLALNLSLKPDGEVASHGIVDATGWSADGSPGNGSLHNFAIGAVRQHFTKSPERNEGIDFRLPEERELMAMEAFQRSLGRKEDLDLDTLLFTDDFINAGLELFNVEAPSRMGTRRCGGCHTNAGANDNAGVNRNRATGTAFAGNAPACLRGFVATLDGGFGVDQEGSRLLKEMCDGGAPAGGPKAEKTFYGDQTMNTPPVVEAADTVPLFHNNIAATVEDAVRFYTSDAFNDSINGADNAFVLSDEQVNQIGAFMRAINGLENLRSSNEYDARAMDREDPAPFEYLVEVALSETNDAIEVLRDGPAELFPGTTVIEDLEAAAELEEQALADGAPDVLADAIELKNQARDAMIIVP